MAGERHWMLYTVPSPAGTEYYLTVERPSVGPETPCCGRSKWRER